MSFRIGRFVFTPSVFATVVTLALLYIMISMAQWQAGKAEYKDNLRDKIVSRKDLAPVSMDELPQSVEDRMFVPVNLSGQYDSEHYFLLDNRVHNGQVGYDVYMPLKMQSGTSILVNRGFVALGRTRQDLPKITTPAEHVSLKGLLDRAPSKAFVLMENVNQVTSWPVVLQYVDLDEIKTMLGVPVFDMILWLDAQDPNALIADQPALNLDSAKNTGYAFQWYAMSVALTLIYFYVNTKRQTNEPDEY